jgi:prepilin-type N-terminal cleavage/methylation domain-containing protein
MQLVAKHNRRKSGFTIIEVMIVLAIAAFILSVIFLAIPALRRNARNVTRKHAVELTAGAIEQFNALYGHYPQNAAEGDSFKDGNPEIANRFNLEFHDFGGNHYYLPPFDTIAIEYGHWCNRYGNGNNATDPIAGDHRSANLYVIWTLIEPDDPHSVFCVDNWDQQSNLPLP